MHTTTTRAGAVALAATLMAGGLGATSAHAAPPKKKGCATPMTTRGPLPSTATAKISFFNRKEPRTGQPVRRGRYTVIVRLGDDQTLYNPAGYVKVERSAHPTLGGHALTWVDAHVVNETVNPVYSRDQREFIESGEFPALFGPYAYRIVLEAKVCQRRGKTGSGTPPMVTRAQIGPMKVTIRGTDPNITEAENREENKRR
jgi:hypothetical protein